MDKQNEEIILNGIKNIENRIKEVKIADGIPTLILNKKGNYYKVWVIGSRQESYLIEENGVYSHGSTLKEARESLIYKIGDRDTSKYRNYNLDTIVSKSEAIKMYRCITGACAYGVKNFVESQKTRKKKFNIKEIINLTKGQYGHSEFKDFFNNKEIIK